MSPIRKTNKVTTFTELDIRFSYTTPHCHLPYHKRRAPSLLCVQYKGSRSIWRHTGRRSWLAIAKMNTSTLMIDRSVIWCGYCVDRPITGCMLLFTIVQWCMLESHGLEHVACFQMSASNWCLITLSLNSSLIGIELETLLVIISASLSTFFSTSITVACLWCDELICMSPWNYEVCWTRIGY